MNTRLSQPTTHPACAFAGRPTTRVALLGLAAMLAGCIETVPDSTRFAGDAADGATTDTSIADTTTGDTTTGDTTTGDTTTGDTTTDATTTDDSAQLDATQPDTSTADTTTGDTAIADATIADTTTPDAAQPDTTTADTSTADTAQPDTTTADTTTADTTTTDTATVDTTTTDTTTADTALPDAGCTTGAACDDGNPCTFDSCAAGACGHAPLTSTTFEPAPCDDGDPCTLADACAAGSCTAGKPRLWERFVALTDGAGGGGVAHNGKIALADGLGTGPPWVQSFALDDGAPGWKLNVHTQKGSTLGVAAASDGSFVAIGTVATSGGTSEAMVSHVSGSGSLLSSDNVSTGVAVNAAAGVLPDNNGPIVTVVGFALDATTSVQRAFLFRYSLATHAVDGKIQTWGSSGHERTGRAVTWRGGGIAGYVVAGSAVEGGSERGWLLATTATGTIGFDVTLPGNATTRITAIASAAGGGHTVGGYIAGVPNDGGGNLWIARTNAGGAQLWERHWGTVNNDALATLVAVGEDVLVGGTIDIVGGTGGRAWYGRIDAWGNLRWSRDDAAKPSKVDEIALIGDEILIAAVDSTTGTPRLRVSRADRWGYPSCAASGGCVGQTFATCDDGNPCTSDDCKPGPTCSHAPYAPASACGSTATCDGAGSCK